MQYKYLNPWLAVAARKINKSFFSWKKKIIISLGMNDLHDKLLWLKQREQQLLLGH